LNNSDLIKLTYEEDDPGICQQTLVIFNEDGELTQFILISAEEAREHREILRKERRSPGLPDDIKALLEKLQAGVDEEQAQSYDEAVKELG
jgi:hypothetical protein